MKWLTGYDAFSFNRDSGCAVSTADLTQLSDAINLRANRGRVHTLYPANSSFCTALTNPKHSAAMDGLCNLFIINTIKTAMLTRCEAQY